MRIVTQNKKMDPSVTRKSDRASKGLPGNANSFSIPLVFFQCMHLFVGGARSNAVTISVVPNSCDLILLADIFFTSSTISFFFERFLLTLEHPENELT